MHIRRYMYINEASNLNIYVATYAYSLFCKYAYGAYSWVQYETCFGVPDFQNQTRQQLK